MKEFICRILFYNLSHLNYSAVYNKRIKILFKILCSQHSLENSITRQLQNSTLKYPPKILRTAAEIYGMYKPPLLI